MIPTTSILHNNDGTLWWIYDPSIGLVDWDRFCNTCRGWTRYENDGKYCTDCGGTGRDTFDIEVATPEDKGFGEFIDTYRVSIIPHMVLPIVRYGHHDEARIVKRLNPSMDGKDWFIVTPNTEIGKAERIALPLDAQPDMLAIMLQII